MAEDVEEPAGWEKVSLEKLAFIKGRAPSKLYDFEEKNLVKYLTPEYLRGGNYKTFYCNINEAETVDDDVVVLWDGSNAGEIFFAEDGAIASTMSKIEISEEFHKLFFYYYLKFYEPVLKYQIKGSGIPHVEKDIFGLLPNLFPSLSEQRKIAEILETVDNAIERTDTIIEKYKRIKQGLMQDLLTRGVVENDELGVMCYELRDEKKHRFKDSPLGRIPEEWEVVELGEVGKITYGEGLSESYYEEYGDSNVYGTGGIIAKSNKFLGVGEALVIPRKGTINNKFYVKEEEKFWVIDTAFYLKPNIVAKYLFYKLETLDFNMLNEATGVPSLNKNTLDKIKVAIPKSIEEQHRIASILSQTDETIEKEQKYKEKLERIKQGLMEDLLTGKVRVNHLIKKGMENVQPA